MLKSQIKDNGLSKRLPRDHPLMLWYSKTLGLTHGPGSDAAKNYLANVSRVLCSIDQWLRDRDTVPSHWSDLMTAPVEAYSEYLKK